MLTGMSRPLSAIPVSNILISDSLLRTTAEQIDFFLENGYVVIKQAFTKEKADAFTKNIWVRLGMDPNDKSTWNQERVHMPPINREKVATFAPKVHTTDTYECTPPL